jgi:ketopantoate reductase
MIAHHMETTHSTQEVVCTLIGPDATEEAVVQLLGSERQQVTSELVIVAVKAYDLDTVLDDYRHLLSNARWVVLVQSALNLDRWQRDWVYGKLHAAAMMVAVRSSGPLKVIEPCRGYICLGPIPYCGQVGDIGDLAALFARALATQSVADISGPMFAKVAINTAMTPMCVASGLSFGETFRDIAVINTAAHVLAECGAIACGCGFRDSARWHGMSAATVSNVENACEVVTWITKDFAGAMPSVVIDIAKGRRTEMPFWHDEMLDVGRAANVSTPWLECMAAEVTPWLKGEHQPVSTGCETLANRICRSVESM